MTVRQNTTTWCLTSC